MSPSGGSILMTSAPRSASIRPQWGPASTREKSSTVMPSSGPGPRRGADMPQNVGTIQAAARPAATVR